MPRQQVSVRRVRSGALSWRLVPAHTHRLSIYGVSHSTLLFSCKMVWAISGSLFFHVHFPSHFVKLHTLEDVRILLGVALHVQVNWGEIYDFENEI